ncbi:hypothetical protein JCM17380_39150 [Desulfosporosinus burensis]
MTKMYSKTNILAQIISAFLFVTIITANPTTVTGDLNTKEIQTAAVSPEVVTNVPETPAPEIPTNTQDPNPVPTPQPASAKTSTPTAPAKKAQPQPSRSISASTSATPPKTTSQLGKASAIIATGKQYIGVNYLYGGTTPAGFDCSGFVQYVFAKNGISLPRVSRDQYKVGTSVSFSNLQPGDLVFFSLAKNGVVDHDGIYIGNGEFINSASSKGVTIYTLGPYWQSAYLGAKRVI